MTSENRKTRSLGRVGAVALVVSLAASFLLALRPGDGAVSPEDRMRSRRLALRASEIRVMDIFGQNYGSTDWSLITNDLATHPEDPANPAFMSVPLSLANVYLNRYELRRDKADLERSLEMFEWVASSRGLWGGRDASGSVVSYLVISLSRLRAECDVGGFEARIDALWRTAMTITAEEARAVLEGGGARPGRATRRSGSGPVSCPSFRFPRKRYGHPRGALRGGVELPGRRSACTEWAQSAATLPCAFRLPSVRRRRRAGSCAGRPVVPPGRRRRPVEFDTGSGGRGTGQGSLVCSPFPAGYETEEPVDVVAPGDSLATAIRDSRVVAFYLSKFLWQFPPGSQCADDEDENIPREPHV